MSERQIDIQTADGRMDAFVTHPDEGGPFPAVIVLMDIWGLREELFDVRAAIAVVGYHCTVPNFWYRRGKVRYEFRNEKGRMRSLAAICRKEVQDEMHANMSHLTDAMAMADIGAVLKFLDGEPVRKGPKGTIGYCLGGWLSLAAAAEFPDHFRASRQPARHAARQRRAGIAAPLRRQDARRDLLRLRREGRSGAAVDHRDAG